MPVTAPNENMDVDSDNNAGEASTSKSNENASTSGLNVSKTTPDSGKLNVMASSAVVPSISVSLHPLVIMNISEHWTRIRAQNGNPQQGKIPFNICCGFYENFIY